jgi:hypothetical protein
MAEDPSVTPRRQQGTSRAYILDRLRRENQTDFIDAIERGEVSPHAVAVQLNWVRRPPTAGVRGHHARRRQLRFQAIDGGLSAGQMMELQYGPNPSAGSLFSSREELVDAWQRARERLMAVSNPGRRPQAFYEFEFTGRRPSYATERSVLWKMGLLSAGELGTLETEWKAAFREAQAPDFTLNDGSGELLKGDCARLAHYEHHDIPRELVRRWEKAERRRRSKTANGIKN